MKTKSILFSVFLLVGIGLQAQPLPTGNSKDFKVKPCLHSISYSGSWRGQALLSVDAFLLKAKELGYEGVMLMAKRPHVSPLDYDAAARTKLKNRIKELGLTLVCLAGYTDFTAGMEKPGIPMMEMQVAYVEELAKLASDLGTNMIRIFTAYERDGIPYDRQFAAVVEGIRLAGEKAAKYGVTLIVQNHHDIALHHDAMYWLLKEINHPNVKAAWDAWSPQLEGLSAQEIRASVLKMKPYLLHTTTADYLRMPRFHYDNYLTNFIPETPVVRAVPMGEGIIDYKTFINALKEIGYQGYIAYEMCEVLEGGGSIDNLDRTAKKFLEYVKQF